MSLLITPRLDTPADLWHDWQRRDFNEIQMDEREYRLHMLARIRDHADVSRELRLDAARQLADAGDVSAETLEILYAESARVSRIHYAGHNT